MKPVPVLLRPRPPWLLGAQLVAAMIAVVVLSVVIVIGGMALFYGLADSVLRETLPADALRAYVAVNDNRMPQLSDLQALLDSAKRWESQIELWELGTLLTFGAVAIAAGVTAARWLARRISEPLHRVAAAARRVAGGDLSARVEQPRAVTGETHQLIADFNLMAEEMERAEREMREHVAAIAHELRTPLTVLRGRLQGMADGVFPADSRGLAGLILQVDALGRVVDDLRTLSLAMSGRLTLNAARIDLAAEVDAALDSLLPEMGAAGLSVERDLEPTEVVADAARLRQILLALLENVRRYAASGGVVRIETRSDHGGARLRVLDRGPGFKAGDEARVFERFWRADDSRSRDSGGTGLGLAVVKAIAEAHGGAAVAFARAGGGAGFEIRLPY